jgi:hypothetical protein
VPHFGDLQRRRGRRVRGSLAIRLRIQTIRHVSSQFASCFERRTL